MTVVVLVAATGQRLGAQGVGERLGPHFGAQIIALRQDGYFSGAWSPGLGLTFRLPLFGAIAGQLSLSDVHTRRWEELSCPGTGSCPAPRKVSGGTTTATASMGATLQLGEYVGFTGLGLGRTWDYQSRGMLEYGGPTWVWDVSIQRMLKPDLGIEFGYRLLRMSWDSGYEHILQGIHMIHHQLSAGVTYAPWD